MTKQGADVVAEIMGLVWRYTRAWRDHDKMTTVEGRAELVRIATEPAHRDLIAAIAALVRERDRMRPGVDVAVEWHDEIWEHMSGHAELPEKSWPEINGPLEEAIIAYRAVTASPSGDDGVHPANTSTG